MNSEARRVVDLDTLKIPFAFDINGKWIKAPDVDLAAIPVKLTCPGCGDVVTFRRGSIGRIPHFAHRPNSSCSNEGYEGLAHQKLKEATADLIEEVGAGALIHGAPPELTAKRGATIEEVYPRTENLRSDVGVPLGDGNILGFEIIVANSLSMWKVNQVAGAGHMICSMNGFGFTEHIMQNGGADDFDLDADARAFVLQWRFTLKHATAPGTRKAAPAGVTFIGGEAINCHAAGSPLPEGQGAGRAAPLQAEPGWYTSDDVAGPAALPGDLRRQHALRIWHTNPHKYPDPFKVCWDRGDFGSEQVNDE